MGEPRVGLADYDADLRPFRLLNVVRDTLGLVFALGRRRAISVVGHDFGASAAAWCALVRPDVFSLLGTDERAVRRPAGIAICDGREVPAVPSSPDIHEALAALERPRKHYQVVLFEARRERADVARASGRARVSASVFPPQERGLGREQAA